jgi:putative transposase
MIVFEFKLKGKPHQYLAVDKAIQTVQFVRNKCVRLWMDGDKVGQKEIYAYTTRLRKEFPFVDKLNSTTCQQAVERAWTAISRFYDNCKRQIKGKKGYRKFQKDNPFGRVQTIGMEVIGR